MSSNVGRLPFDGSNLIYPSDSKNFNALPPFEVSFGIATFNALSVGNSLRSLTFLEYAPIGATTVYPIGVRLSILFSFMKFSKYISV